MASPSASLLKSHPPMPPFGALLWTAVVDVGGTVPLGPGPKGDRFMVPILGGTFAGSADHEALRGKVLPGGADRQLMRRDGVKELDAIYEMQTDCGTILSIRNRVIVDTTRTPDRYAMSAIEVTAPEGPFAWLGRRLIVGTLQSARPDIPAVIVRAWMMDAQPPALD